MASARVRPAMLVDRFFQFSLLGLVASGFFALAGTGRLDLPTIVITSAGLLWRALMLLKVVRAEIPSKAVTAAAVALLLFYPVDFYFLSRDFFAATVHGVCFLGVLRVLTAKTGRDHLFTGAVAFLELVGAALLAFQATFLLWLVAAVACSIAAFTSADIRRGFQIFPQTSPVNGRRLTWHLGFIAAGSTLWILTMGAVLFFVVPRGARAAAQLFPNLHHVTGFASVVDLGRFGEIVKDDRAVMHVLSYSKPLPPDLKWRGATLGRFDGRRWSEPPSSGMQLTNPRGSVLVADPYQRSRRGQRYIYRVDVSNSDTGTLFIAGIPEFLNVEAPRLMRTPDDAFRVIPPTGEQLRYEVSAHIDVPLPYLLTPAERARYLELPPIDSRIFQLAREWGGEGSDEQRAKAIEGHLQREFTYTLETGYIPVRDPLAHFLFETKRGYCEYFASAMAVMLRTMGVPSRVATGFQSGYMNPVSGLTVIRASDAHAWVEAWINGRGWVTYDPTPYAAPTAHTGVFARLSMYLDAIDSAWQQWVMSYDLNRQASLAARFQNALQAWRKRQASMTHEEVATVNNAPPVEWIGEWIVLPLVILLALWMFGPRIYRRLRRSRTERRILRTGGGAGDASLLYQRMLELLDRRGFRKPAWFTPMEFARSLPSEERPRVIEFTEVYNHARFGGDGRATAHLVEILRGMESR